jgi:hypothetical protein
VTSRLRPFVLGPSGVAFASLVLTALFVTNALATFQWDATSFVSFGSDTPTRGYAENLLGEVILRGELGHDGKYFFVQANDPWVTDAETHAALLDFPVYRSQRMLYPMVASGFGLLGPEAIVWGLLLVNVASIAVGTWATARLARNLGGSAWWGLAFALNLGVIYTLTIDTAGILAAACSIWAVALLYENRFRLSVALLIAAALSRELMLICAAGIAIWLWMRAERVRALLAVGLPVLSFGLWNAYLLLRLGPDEGTTGNIGPPFVGLVRAIPRWWDDVTVLVVGVCVFGLALAFVVRWWATRSLLSWAFIGFVPLAVVMTAKVWTLVFDFTRALTPFLTAAVLLIFVERREASKATNRDVVYGTAP